MATQLRSIAPPQEWAHVEIPELDAKLYDGSAVYAPGHKVEVATRYPTDKSGELVANITHAQMAGFLRNYNASNGTNYRTLMLYEDEFLRDQLGKDHAMFDENFERNEPWRWGYVADFTRPYGQTQEGINGQELVTRIAYWRLPEENVELGAVTIAPDGMVPTLTRKQLEKMVGNDGLRRLEQLRGKPVDEAAGEVVDVRNALGYPQFTLDHSQRDENGLIPHNSHVYRPEQDYGDAVGVRDASWGHRGELGCFYVDLSADPEYSRSGRSFPLVRGDVVEAKIARPSYTVRV